jgi:hypothetical protein
MTAATTDERGARAGHIDEEYGPRLRQYFLRQLGSTREADECVRETVRRISVLAEDETARVLARVMRAAAALCAERLEEKMGKGAAFIYSALQLSATVKAGSAGIPARQSVREHA